MTRKPMWSAEAIKAYESGQGVELVNIPHPHYKPLPEDLNPESLETVEIDLPDPWSPVSIGVDITAEGVHVVGIYALDNDTSQVFYSKFYPAPHRTWVGLTLDDIPDDDTNNLDFYRGGRWAERILKEKNNG